jgi:hypothetical protein
MEDIAEKIIEATEEPKTPVAPEPIVKKPIDEKERARIEYEFRHTFGEKGEALEKYQNLTHEVMEIKRNLAISESLRKFGLTEDDVEIIWDEDPTKIGLKAEKLASKYVALKGSTEKEVTEKVQATVPDFRPKFTPVEGNTIKEKMANLEKKH